MALLHNDRGGIVSGIRQALGIEVLISRIDLDAPVPGFAFGKLKAIGLARLFQDPALILGHVAASETEQDRVDGCLLDGSEDE